MPVKKAVTGLASQAKTLVTGIHTLRNILQYSIDSITFSNTLFNGGQIEVMFASRAEQDTTQFGNYLRSLMATLNTSYEPIDHWYLVGLEHDTQVAIRNACPDRRKASVATEDQLETIFRNY